MSLLLHQHAPGGTSVQATDNPLDHLIQLLPPEQTDDRIPVDFFEYLRCKRFRRHGIDAGEVPGGKPRIIMDGFSAHEDLDFIWYCHALTLCLSAFLLILVT